MCRIEEANERSRPDFTTLQLTGTPIDVLSSTISGNHATDLSHLHLVPKQQFKGRGVLF